ncbi:MAG: Protein HflK [Gammaproteobacteria bacterium]|nr:Protein HflK [Gammaproteobacteria bacterium]
MGWNEPPDKNKGRDPWGSRGNGEGPPDIDEVVRKIQKGIGGLFSKKPAAMNRNNGLPYTWLLPVLVLIAITLYDVIYFIDQQERGIVLRFGSYQRIWQPGLNFRLPWPVESTIRLNVEQVRPLTHQALMLTQDENIVDVEVAVQWKIRDSEEYLFNVFDPDYTLTQVTESAVREVIGKSKLDFVLTEGRSQIALSQLQLIQETLDNEYKIGIQVSTVQMQPAKPPDEVKEAFDDAIKSREDEQRSVNEAEAYRNDIIPRARGAAARLREESNAYKQRVIARAEGEASRFSQLLAEYERAPAITRQRLYLDTMESVLSSTSKVFLDVDGNNSLMYIPLDKLIRDGNNSSSIQNDARAQPQPESSVQIIDNIRSRTEDRDRGAR